jgi:charged multivesicular body protein 2A
MTPAERLRKHQRALEKTQRELDRERVKLENQEKKLIQDIRKSAKNGQIGAAKIQAKDLVRTRRYDGISSNGGRSLIAPVILANSTR